MLHLLRITQKSEVTKPECFDLPIDCKTIYSPLFLKKELTNTHINVIQACS